MRTPLPTLALPPRQLTHPSLEQYSRIEGGAYIDWELRDHLASRVESFRGVIRGLEKRRERRRVVDQTEESGRGETPSSVNEDGGRGEGKTKVRSSVGYG